MPTHTLREGKELHSRGCMEYFAEQWEDSGPGPKAGGGGGARSCFGVGLEGSVTRLEG